MDKLYLYLLGGFRLEGTAAEEIELKARKSQALLAYLACCAGSRQSRDKLAGLLWGGSCNKLARSNLRQALVSIRRAVACMPEPVVLKSGPTVYVDTRQIELDVTEFDRLCDDVSLESKQQASGIYQGDFLDGFTLDEPEFEQWMLCERRRLRERQIQLLQTLLEAWCDRADYQQGIETANKLLAMDPLQESVHVILMRAYHALGRQRGVIQQFEACKEVFQRELESEPSTEAHAVYRELMSHPIIRVAKHELATGWDTPAALPVNGDDSGSVPNQISIVGPVFNPGFYTRPGVATTLLLLLLSAGSWLLWTSAESPDTSQAALTDSNFSMPERPSIAVLPLMNIDGEGEQRYFSDGLSEDVRTDLSRISGLIVIASSSSFSYRDSQLEFKDIARALGVDYLLHGSVQKSGDRVRINAKLMDAETGAYVWSDRYDRNFTEILALQDEITRTIVRELAVTLTLVEEEQFALTRNVDVDAYDQLLRGLQPLRQFTAEGLVEARAYFNRALALDPNYADGYAILAQTASYSGHLDEALSAIRKARMLSPITPFSYLWVEAHTLYLMGRYAEARPLLEEVASRNPEFVLGLLTLAATYGQLGMQEEAAWQREEILTLNPEFSIASEVRDAPYLLPQHRQHYIDGLRKAALLD